MNLNALIVVFCYFFNLGVDGGGHGHHHHKKIFKITVPEFHKHHHHTHYVFIHHHHKKPKHHHHHHKKPKHHHHHSHHTHHTSHHTKTHKSAHPVHMTKMMKPHVMMTKSHHSDFPSGHQVIVQKKIIVNKPPYNGDYNPIQFDEVVPDYNSDSGANDGDYAEYYKNFLSAPITDDEVNLSDGGLELQNIGHENYDHHVPVVEPQDEFDTPASTSDYNGFDDDFFKEQPAEIITNDKDGIKKNIYLVQEQQETLSEPKTGFEAHRNRKVTTVHHVDSSKYGDNHANYDGDGFAAQAEGYHDDINKYKK